MVKPQIFTVVLPWGPTMNNLYRNRKGRGRPYMNPTARDWYDAAKAAIRLTPGYRRHLFPKGTRVRVSHKLVPHDRRGFDLDNRDKAIYDALQKSGLIANDVQIFAGDRVKYDRQPGGRFAGYYVTVERLPDDFGAVFHLNDVGL